MRYADLDAYLDEALPAEEMARIEQALRADPELVKRLSDTSARRDAGQHALGAIWRRHRMSCPSRQQLGSFLLGAMPAEAIDYVRFHLEVVGCRCCLANLEDLKEQRSEQPEATRTRRRRYLQSSLRLLRRA